MAEIHADLVDIIYTVNTDVVQMGQYRGFNEALVYLDMVRLAEPRTAAWLKGFDEARGNVEADRPLHPAYLTRVKEMPEGLDFDPTNLLAVLADVDQDGADLGHWQAIEAGRAQRDTEVGNPDLADYVSDPDDPYADEDEVQEYQDRVDYIDGLEFVPVCLAEHFAIDPDPDWEPRCE